MAYATEINHDWTKFLGEFLFTRIKSVLLSSDIF